MTEVRIRCVRLDEGAPAVVRDTEAVWDLGVDDRHATPELAEALREILQEAVDSGRWQRVKNADRVHA